MLVAINVFLTVSMRVWVILRLGTLWWSFDFSSTSLERTFEWVNFARCFRIVLRALFKMYILFILRSLSHQVIQFLLKWIFRFTFWFINFYSSLISDLVYKLKFFHLLASFNLLVYQLFNFLVLLRFYFLRAFLFFLMGLRILCWI